MVLLIVKVVPNPLPIADCQLPIEKDNGQYY